MKAAPAQTAASRRCTLLVVLWLALPFGRSVGAHDIPADVLVQLFARAQDRTLHVMVRVPLGAMRDVEFPLHGQGFLTFPVPDDRLRDAARLWIAGNLDVFENDAPLRSPTIVATRVTLPADKSFASFDEAAAHLRGPPVPAGTEIAWNQALLDVWLDWPIASEQSRFSIRPALARLGVRVVTVLRFQTPGGAVRGFEYSGDPGLIRLDPRWHQTVGRFVALGFEHILDGIDHLLFLFCLVIPFRQWRPLVMIVTSFTAAHSITLIASAFNLAPGGLWFPPLIETLIALSIVYMALENIVLSAGARTRSAQAVADQLNRRWMVAFAFGLVHGFGFSFALKQTLQFAGSHLLASLFAFNVGIELGQLLVLVLLVPALGLVFRRLVPEVVGTIILSALVAHTAWHWMTERYRALSQFDWPGLGAPAVGPVLRALVVVLAIAGLGVLGRLAWRSRKQDLRAGD